MADTGDQSCDEHMEQISILTQSNLTKVKLKLCRYTKPFAKIGICMMLAD